MLQIALMLVSIFDHCATPPVTPQPSPQMLTDLTLNRLINNFTPCPLDVDPKSEVIDVMWEACTQAARCIAFPLPIVSTPAPETLNSKRDPNDQVKGPFSTPIPRQMQLEGFMKSDWIPLSPTK